MLMVLIETNTNLMIFLLASLYVHYVIFLSVVMHDAYAYKIMKTFGNWLII